jgi:HEAT repeat protein
MKYLRRSEKPGPEGEPFAKVVEDLLPPDIETADTRAVTNALLRRVEIIQDRGKKIRMLRTISHLETPWASLVFLELLGDPSEEIRDVAVRELARRSDWPASALYPRLENPPWFAKCSALRVLGLKQDAGALPRLVRTLADPNAEVKRTAAWALGRIGGPEARRMLVKLVRDPNRYVRTAAVEALDRLCDFKFS